MMAPLFIRERLDGVMARGAQTGIERPERRTEDGYARGDRPPGGHNHHRNRGGHQRANEPVGPETENDPENASAYAEYQRLSDDYPQDKELRSAEGLENADLARPLEN